MDLNEYKDILLQYVIAARSYVIDTFTRMASSCTHCEVDECEFYDMVTQFLFLLQFAELRVNILDTTVECLPQEEDGPIIVEVDNEGLPIDLPQAFEVYEEAAILQQAAVAHEAFPEEDQAVDEYLIHSKNVQQARVAPGNIYFGQPEYDAPQVSVEENSQMPEYDNDEIEIIAFNWDNVEGPVPSFSPNVSDFSENMDESDDDESSSLESVRLLYEPVEIQPRPSLRAFRFERAMSQRVRFEGLLVDEQMVGPQLTKKEGKQLLDDAPTYNPPLPEVSKDFVQQKLPQHYEGLRHVEEVRRQMLEIDEQPYEPQSEDKEVVQPLFTSAYSPPIAEVSKNFSQQELPQHYEALRPVEEVRRQMHKIDEQPYEPQLAHNEEVRLPQASADSPSREEFLKDSSREEPSQRYEAMLLKSFSK